LFSVPLSKQRATIGIHSVHSTTDSQHAVIAGVQKGSLLIQRAQLSLLPTRRNAGLVLQHFIQLSNVRPQNINTLTAMPIRLWPNTTAFLRKVRGRFEEENRVGSCLSYCFKLVQVRCCLYEPRPRQARKSNYMHSQRAQRLIKVTMEREGHNVLSNKK